MHDKHMGMEHIPYVASPLHRVEHSVTVQAREEIRGITWDLDGWLLYPRQRALYAHAAGFQNTKVLHTAIAVFDGESGGWTKAWHINVVRNEDGTIFRDVGGRFTATSVDLGWIQRSVKVPDVALTDDGAAAWVASVFASNPDLALPGKAGKIAYALYQQRGWDPWYAYLNGGYERHRGNAALAIGNWLAFYSGLGGGYLRVA